MPMLLQIQGHHLPGRVWRSREEYYDNIHVGVQVGKEPSELVRGDAASSSWSGASGRSPARINAVK